MRNFPHLACILILIAGLNSQSARAFVTWDCNGVPVFPGFGVRSFNYGANLFDSEEVVFTEIFARVGQYSTAVGTGLAVSDPSVGLNNGENEIWWDGTNGSAVCSIWWVAPAPPTQCTLTESDIRIGSPTWITVEDSTHSPYVLPTDSARSLHGTALHEAGHCVGGLAHDNSTYNIMGEDWDHVTRDGTTTYYGVGEDASNGIIAVHGKRSGGSDTYRDVGATVFRYQGTAGAYSAHKWGRLLTTGGSELPKSGSYFGQDSYRVVAGDNIQMEITLENNGEKNSEIVNIGYYLSNNDIISTSDTEVKVETGFVLNRGTVLETTRTITIPLDTPPGNWFLGAYIDHDSLIPETVNFTNNIAYYPITIAPPDLVTQSPSVDDNTLYPGQLFSAFATAANNGDAQAANTTLRYYRSDDSTISTTDTQLATDPVVALAPGATSPENAGVFAPNDVGNYWIGACVDSVAGETATANQCSSGVAVTVAYLPPVVFTGASTAITTTDATLRGTVNPLGAATFIAFEWGTSTAYGAASPWLPMGSGIGLNGTTFDVTGLVCDTTYHYRAVALSEGGISYGEDATFTTQMCGGCE